MLKGIIIVTLAFYVFYKITSFFFRAGAASQQSNRQVRNDEKKNKSGEKTKGGEYIDYEDVK